MQLLVCVYIYSKLQKERSEPEMKERRKRNPQHWKKKKRFLVPSLVLLPRQPMSQPDRLQSASSPSGRKAYHGVSQCLSVLVWHQSLSVLLLSFPNTHTHRQTHLSSASASFIELLRHTQNSRELCYICLFLSHENNPKQKIATRCPAQTPPCLTAQRLQSLRSQGNLLVINHR